MLQKYNTDNLLIFVRYLKHRMQITQERWEYDLMTNSVKSMQQTTSLLSGYSSLCNWYLLQYTYITNGPKVKANATNVHLRYKHKLTRHFTPLTGASFINDSSMSAAAHLHVNHPLLQISDITDPLLSIAAFFFRF